MSLPKPGKLPPYSENHLNPIHLQGRWYVMKWLWGMGDHTPEIYHHCIDHWGARGRIKGDGTWVCNRCKAKFPVGVAFLAELIGVKGTFLRASVE